MSFRPPAMGTRTLLWLQLRLNGYATSRGHANRSLPIRKFGRLNFDCMIPRRQRQRRWGIPDESPVYINLGIRNRAYYLDLCPIGLHGLLLREESLHNVQNV